MPNLMFDRTGFAIKQAAALTNAFAIFEVGADTNVPSAAAVPNQAEINGVIISLTSIAGGAASVTAYLCMDSLGDRPITPGATLGATQLITTGLSGGGGAAVGGVSFEVDHDYHYDNRAVGGSTGEKRLFVVIKLDAGTATADIRVTWRG